MRVLNVALLCVYTRPPKPHTTHHTGEGCALHPAYASYALNRSSDDVVAQYVSNALACATATDKGAHCSCGWVVVLCHVVAEMSLQGTHRSSSSSSA